MNLIKRAPDPKFLPSPPEMEAEGGAGPLGVEEERVVYSVPTCPRGVWVVVVEGGAVGPLLQGEVREEEGEDL